MTGTGSHLTASKLKDIKNLNKILCFPRQPFYGLTSFARFIYNKEFTNALFKIKINQVYLFLAAKNQVHNPLLFPDPVEGDQRRAEGHGGESFPRQAVSDRCSYCQVKLNRLKDGIAETNFNLQDHEDEKDLEPQLAPDRALQPAEVPCQAARCVLKTFHQRPTVF